MTRKFEVDYVIKDH